MSTATAPKVKFNVKAAMMCTGLSASLDSRLSVAEALGQVRQIPAKDAGAQRVLNQLAREVAGTHDYLAINERGQARKVDPTTPLLALAIPREIKTLQGIEVVPTVSVEVQAYAPVG